jgi:aminopeptidase
MSLLASAPEAIFDLRRVPFPPEYAEGARNAVGACLRIEASEKVTLITDDACLQIAASIVAELESVGCEWNAFILEAVGTRPLTAMPSEVLDDMETSQVSIFVVETQPNEMHSRLQMTDVVNRRRMRHANMAGITGEIMMQGMRADFNEIDILSQAVLERLRAATYIRATTPAGTDIHAQLSPAHRWFKTSGIISPGRWANLPGGECFTAPGEVNGVFVVDGVAGDVLCSRYGILRDNPISIDIEGNRIAHIRCANKDLERDFWSITHSDANSDRVGEIAIGTNLGVREVIGNILQDEKLPGVHLAFGDPYGAQTGANWKSDVHLDVVGLNFSIWLGDANGEEQIMRDGEFTLDR